MLNYKAIYNIENEARGPETPLEAQIAEALNHLWSTLAESRDQDFGTPIDAKTNWSDESIIRSSAQRHILQQLLTHPDAVPPKTDAINYAEHARAGVELFLAGNKNLQAALREPTSKQLPVLAQFSELLGQMAAVVAARVATAEHQIHTHAAAVHVATQAAFGLKQEELQAIRTAHHGAEPSEASHLHTHAPTAAAIVELQKIGAHVVSRSILDGQVPGTSLPVARAA